MKNTMNCKIGKTMVKFRVIREYDGTVRGYSLGGNTLTKERNSFNNGYYWVIKNNNNIIEYANSCQLGKERLVDLYIEDVRLW